MALDNHQMAGLGSKVRKVLQNIFDNWLPSAVMTLTNKVISSCTITNDVTGNVTGNVTGDLAFGAADALTADEDMSDTDFASSFVTLDGTASCAITNWTPTVGKLYVFRCITSVANSPTIALSSGGTWDGTNDLATFDAIGEFLVVMCVAALTLEVIANPDSIAFS
jgi:hypothetical protein